MWYELPNKPENTCEVFEQVGYVSHMSTIRGFAGIVKGRPVSGYTDILASEGLEIQ
jgi:hypothetical protein